jgi:hypothetical protein
VVYVLTLPVVSRSTNSIFWVLRFSGALIIMASMRISLGLFYGLYVEHAVCSVYVVLVCAG